MLIDKSPLTSNISQLLKRKEKSGLPYTHNRTFWFLVNIKHIYEYVLLVFHFLFINLSHNSSAFPFIISLYISRSKVPNDFLF